MGRVYPGIMAMGAAVCHCSVSSALSEASPKPAALLTEQWYTENSASVMNLARTPRNGAPARHAVVHSYRLIA